MDLAGPSWVPPSSSSNLNDNRDLQTDASESSLSGSIRSLGAIFSRQRRSSLSSSSQRVTIAPTDLSDKHIQHQTNINNHHQNDLHRHHLHEGRLAELSPLRLPTTSAGTIPQNNNNNHNHNHNHHHNHLAAISTTNLDGSHLNLVGEISRQTNEQEQPETADQLNSWQHQLGKHVKLDLVRDLIVDYSLELAIILVILIYLAYYFSRISRRPKLIGNRRSDFVASIKLNFRQTLKSRFSPLIYFWGTNPQTALFGYLLGQTSNDEVPRSKFHRQFLYVSDVQYLTSNVDLSEHYEKRSRMAATDSPDLNKPAAHINQHRHQQSQHQHHRLCKLDDILHSDTPPGDNQHQKQLRENLQLVMGSHRLEVDSNGKDGDKVYYSESDEEELARHGSGASGDAQRTSGAAKLVGQLVFKRTSSADSSEASAMGSSSDSGVFANCESGSSSSNSSSFSSASSNSSLTIDMPTPEMVKSVSKSSRSSTSSTISCSSSSKGSDCGRHLCDCNSPYESKVVDFIRAEVTAEKRLKSTQKLKREHFESGQCALDWYLDSHQQYHKNKAVALISAGMTTGSDKKYVTDTVQTLHKLGYEVCVFIRRGVGGLKLNSTKFFSPSKWHDFETAIMSVKKQRPDCRLVAIGFSFGSIELCRYLAMSGDRSLVASALLVSCPFDPEAGGRNMRKDALNRKIDAYLAKNLGKQLFHALQSQATSDDGKYQIKDSGEENARTEPLGPQQQQQQQQQKQQQRQCVYANYNGSVIDLSSLPKIKSLVDFEDNYNRVIQNYPNSDAYGADSRLSDQLGQIKTPTLCLSSEDDFMAPAELLPIKQVEANENLCMILTKRGGHMAFIDGLVWPKKPYFAQRIIEKFMKLEVGDKQTNNSSGEMTIVK